MSSLTAIESLRIAQKATAPGNPARATSQLRNVSCILVSAAVVSLTSLLLIAFEVVNTADSIKAAASIACLAVLLVVACTYSVAAIFWNVYWRERSRRIEGESELRELEAQLPQIFEASLLKAVEEELASSESSQSAASLKPPLFAGITPDQLRDLARRRVDRQMVAHVRTTLAFSDNGSALQHS